MRVWAQNPWILTWVSCQMKWHPTFNSVSIFFLVGPPARFITIPFESIFKPYTSHSISMCRIKCKKNTNYKLNATLMNRTTDGLIYELLIEMFMQMFFFVFFLGCAVWIDSFSNCLWIDSVNKELFRYILPKQIIKRIAHIIVNVSLRLIYLIKCILWMFLLFLWWWTFQKFVDGLFLFSDTVDRINLTRVKGWNVITSSNAYMSYHLQHVWNKRENDKK